MARRGRLARRLPTVVPVLAAVVTAAFPSSSPSPVRKPRFLASANTLTKRRDGARAPPLPEFVRRGGLLLEAAAHGRGLARACTHSPVRSPKPALLESSTTQAPRALGLLAFASASATSAPRLQPAPYRSHAALPQAHREQPLSATPTMQQGCGRHQAKERTYDRPRERHENDT